MAGQHDQEDIVMGSGDSDDNGSSFVPFTKAERIQQLNEIDKSITSLLHSAGLAIKTLTEAKSSSPSATTGKDPRLAAFEAASDDYLTTLHSIDVRLQRQLLGLDEARVSTTVAPVGAKRDGGKVDGADPGTGDNPLDVGWLNSRSQVVERIKEAETWAKAAKFVEQLDVDSFAGNSNGTSQS